MMEFTSCDEEAPAGASHISMTRSHQAAALQQAESAQSLAASSSCSCSTSASTSTCADFSSGGECGAFEESPVASAARLSLALDIGGQGLRGQVCSRGKACSALSLTLQNQQPQQLQQQVVLQHQQHKQQQQQQQQQQPKLFPEINQDPRPRQQQQARKRSNAISAKSMSSYLAHYKETKTVYFDGVLTGEIPVRRSPMVPRFK